MGKELFLGELADLINKYSIDNDMNTPDFILANYLNNCLKAFGLAIEERERWIHPVVSKNWP